VTTPAGQFPGFAASRGLGAPIRLDFNRRDCARRDRTRPKAVEPFEGPVHVVGVPWHGPIVSLNFLFFHVIIGLDDYSGVSGSWQGRSDLTATDWHILRPFFQWLRFIKRLWRFFSALLLSF